MNTILPGQDTKHSSSNEEPLQLPPGPGPTTPSDPSTYFRVLSPFACSGDRPSPLHSNLRHSVHGPQTQSTMSNAKNYFIDMCSLIIRLIRRMNSDKGMLILTAFGTSNSTKQIFSFVQRGLITAFRTPSSCCIFFSTFRWTTTVRCWTGRFCRITNILGTYDMENNNRDTPQI